MMFSPRNVQSQENANNLVMRKRGTTKPAQRKPLLDRAVNEEKGDKTTPKSKQALKPLAKKLTNTPIPYVDWCSYKIGSNFDEDNYDDICPKSERWTNEDIKNIIAPLIQIPKTPEHVNIEIEDFFLELPPITPVFTYQKEFIPEFDVVSPLPHFEFDEFDF